MHLSTLCTVVAAHRLPIIAVAFAHEPSITSIAHVLPIVFVTYCMPESTGISSGPIDAFLPTPAPLSTQQLPAPAARWVAILWLGQKTGRKHSTY